MKETLEKLWSEYFFEECSVINAEEEKALIKRAAEIRKTMNESLTKEQSKEIEKFIEVSYEIQTFFAKKAFFNGCEFATSFLLETGNFGK